MPKISVIVPIYNAEKYLERCVKSLIAQTFHDIEILLIDDGSTDASSILCARLKKRTAAYAFCISQTAASAVRETRVCLRQAGHSSALSMPMTPYRRHFLKRFCRRLSSITVILCSATSYA